MWLDKTVMDYSNWQRGRPNYRSYGLIKVSDGTWSTGNRWNDKPYICKTAKGKTSTMNLILNPYTAQITLFKSCFFFTV